MIRRVLITGKNNELPREAFSRAAWHDYAPSLQTRPAVSYSRNSGNPPESAAGGPRHPSLYSGSSRNQRREDSHGEPELVDFFIEAAIIFMGGAGVLGLLAWVSYL